MRYDLSPTASLSMPLSASYTFTQGTFDEDFESSDPIFGDALAGDFIPYVPEHQAWVELALNHELFGFAVSGAYTSKMRDAPGQQPLDEALLRELSSGHKVFLTVEENAIAGGAGSAVSEFLDSEGIVAAVHRAGIRDQFVEHGSQGQQRERHGLTAEQLVRLARPNTDQDETESVASIRVQA